MQKSYSHLRINLKSTTPRSSQDLYAPTDREIPTPKICDSPEQKPKHSTSRIGSLQQVIQIHSFQNSSGFSSPLPAQVPPVFSTLQGASSLTILVRENSTEDRRILC